MSRGLILSLALCAVAGCTACGCTNACVELAEKVCSRAGDDLAACEAIPQNSKDEGAAAKGCARMKAVAASCRTLTEKASEADGEDVTACKADLELIRALERQQM